jgi:molybdate transport system substrate-binding protein
MKFTLNHAIYAAALLVLAGSPAAAADISVFSTGAPSAVLKVLAVTFARDTGNHVEFTVGTPGDLQNKLAAGATPDLVVAPVPVVEKLEKAGTLQAGSRVDLARVGVGVVVRAGAPKPASPRWMPYARCCSRRSRSFIRAPRAAASPARRWRA